MVHASHDGLTLHPPSFRTWWWDTWVNPYQLYPIFKPFTSFVSSLDLANLNWQRSNTSISTTSVRVWGMTDTTGRRGLGWLQDDCYTWFNQHEGVVCSYRSGIMVTFSGCWETNGGCLMSLMNPFFSLCNKLYYTAYSATWYDPEGGDVIDIALQRCGVDNTLTYSVPPFIRDVAVVYVLV